MSGSSILKPRPVSGFPEWLPAVRIAEQRWLDRVRATFESFGYAPIETPAVEPLEVLLAKGETDKEIYVLKRLQADERDESDARLALHFDLTVPFARYTAQHFADLSFPFKRYQMQKVWRGERPQDGRYREFYQCDIDVIAQDELPLHYDAEMALVAYRALAAIGVGDVRLHISNRKILSGFLAGLAVPDPVATIRVLDKLDKIAAHGVRAQLAGPLGLAEAVIDKVLALGAIATADTGFAAQIAALGVRHDLLDQGIAELHSVMTALAVLPSGTVVADLAIARGFDYYTGTVYEGRLASVPGFGSVVSGGRYDDLAGEFINRKLPGVGISIGLSRLFGKMLELGRVPVGPATPTQVLVVLPEEDRRAEASATATALRDRGLNVEMYPTAAKLKRQLTYAERKGIPFVWFPPFADGQPHEVKDMTTGAQTHADPLHWQP